jgi:hypothetical protein
MIKNIKLISFLVLLGGILMLTSCSKEEEDITLKYPKVTTKMVHTITTNSAIAGGTITEEGPSAVIKKGVCWGTSPQPSTAGLHTDNGGGKNEFSSQIANLMPGTKYYIRAYAINEFGTGYGTEINFTTN